MKRISKNIILLVVISICIIFGLLYGYSNRLKRINIQNYQFLGKIKESLVSNVPDVSVDLIIEIAQTEYIKADFELLKNQNEDIYAWIIIPGTNIDYPIVKKMVSNDPYDDYYLNHTIDHTAGFPGAIYSHPYSDLYFTDTVTILYGHNLKDGSMFTALHDFEDKIFFYENDQIVIYTPKECLYYEIYAAVEFPDIFIPYEYDFLNVSDLERYLNDIKNCRGNFRESLNVTSDDRLLILSTCYTGRDDVRLLVVGVLCE